jgi:hypothetical protein
MNISIIRHPKEKSEVQLNGITVATCYSEAQLQLTCALFGTALQNKPDINGAWRPEHLTEGFNWLVKEHNERQEVDENDIECDCGDCDVCGH